MGAPSLGPCASYTTPDDVRGCTACDDADVYTDAKLTTAIAVASRVMFLATGRQYPGVCTVANARPCGCDTCCGPVQEMGWATILWPGTTCAGRCRTGQCGCTRVPTIDLGRYPVNSVTEVKVDGVVLDPSAYRVDDYRWVRRIDGDGWPACQNMRLADTEAGTYSVSFTWGLAPSDLVVEGTIALACEIAKACTPGAACGLPERVTTITRQGVTAALLDPQDFLIEGRTGVYLADLAIAQENPDGIKADAGFYNPDTFKPAYSRTDT